MPKAGFHLLLLLAIKCNIKLLIFFLLFFLLCPERESQPATLKWQQFIRVALWVACQWAMHTKRFLTGDNHHKWLFATIPALIPDSCIEIAIIIFVIIRFLS